MAKVGYPGVRDPQTAFAELRPYRERLVALASQCRPFQTDYLMLHAAQTALDACAHYFTKHPQFFARKPEQSSYGGAPDHGRPGREGY
jgi:hypothetical protein